MTQEFIILISAPPTKTQVHLRAMRFLKELAAKKIPVRSVFFYQDAVLIANKLNAPPSDEPQILDGWQQIHSEFKTTLQTCAAASFRRGIMDRAEASERGFEAGNLHECFSITGLGQLAAAMSDKNIKLIHFK